MLEGTIVTLEEKFEGSCGPKTIFKIDTSNILFIASGAFTELEELIAKRLKENVISFKFFCLPPLKFQNIFFYVLQNPKNLNGISEERKKLKKVKAEDLIEFRLKKVIAKDLIKFGMIPVTLNF